MKQLIAAGLLGLALPLTLPAMAADPQPQSEAESQPQQQVLSEEEQYWAWAKETWESLDKRTGEIKLDGAPATLEVGDEFYFLGPEDAQTVLVDVWGNPPGQKPLGMLFPAGVTPFDAESWAVTIEYEADGYVSDEDASKIDYSELLSQMKRDTKEESDYRVKEGYDPIELVGWASEPYYDQQTHKLHWAKEIRFGEAEQNILNYNIRALGRQGVLVLNYIADMSQKSEIDANLDAVMAMTKFDPGNTYDEFNPDIDEVAAYGVGALITGKVLAKTGFLTVLMLFLKKGWIFILAGLGALGKKLFGRNKQA
ncbi:DUF2167 domain-containing protein [Ferrimonas sp.]|uniref:DUF2167 domain-containing protein n=1 Tax=Ferrimonas sp. TaxID=2080861 RepID=UPI003A90C6EE